jgi:hypothetical protein
MSRNIKWVHAPSNEAASHWLPDGYSLPRRRRRERLPFTAGEALTLFEAARLISGCHPYPLSPDGAETLGPHMGFITAGATGLTRRRHRPQRSKAAFEALQQKVMSGEIPAEMCRLTQPGTISDGGIDWLNVKVATADVVRLCEEKGWRCGLLRAPASTPLAGKAGEKKTGERGQGQAIRQAAQELWPAGAPTGLLKKTRNDKIREHLSRKELGKPVDRTIRRAFRGK